MTFTNIKERFYRNDSSDEESGQISLPGREYVFDSVLGQTPKHVVDQKAVPTTVNKGTNMLYIFTNAPWPGANNCFSKISRGKYQELQNNRLSQGTIDRSVCR